MRFKIGDIVIEKRWDDFAGKNIDLEIFSYRIARLGNWLFNPKL